MALDPSIALGVRPLQMPDPLAQMAQVSQIRASQRQNEVAQLQLEQLKQDRAEMQDFQSQLEKSGGNPDLDLLAKTMLKSPKYFEKGVELTKKLKEQKDYDAYLARQAKPAGGATSMTAPAPMNALAASAGASPQPSVNALSAGPTLADLQSQYREVSRFSAPGAKAEAELLKEQIKALQTPREVGGRLVTGAGQVLFESPEKGTELQRNYEYAKKQGFKGNIFDYERDIKLAGRAPATPAQPTPPVAVIDPATGQTIYVSREEALRNRMQPASAATSLKPLTEGQAIKLRTDVGKDYKAASTALTQMDDLLDSIDKVKTAPGLTAATGFTGKYLPSFPEGKAAQAETRLANLRGKVTALGKATAAMSGAIGSIANQEWKILSDQIAVLDEVKGKGPLLEQINLVEQQARGAIDRIRDTYEKTRAEDFERFPQFRDLPAPRGKKDSGGGGIDALLDKYK
jgi:hypothetical protein